MDYRDHINPYYPGQDKKSKLDYFCRDYFLELKWIVKSSKGIGRLILIGQVRNVRRGGIMALLFSIY
jgi:hypothetical protein